MTDEAIVKVNLIIERPGKPARNIALTAVGKSKIGETVYYKAPDADADIPEWNKVGIRVKPASTATHKHAKKAKL